MLCFRKLEGVVIYISTFARACELLHRSYQQLYEDKMTENDNGGQSGNSVPQ